MCSSDLRIQEIEGKLSAAQIIDPSEVDAGGRVVFGATVELEEETSGEKVTYQIVGEDEADLKLGLINISSPIARALIGKEEGDVAVVVGKFGADERELFVQVLAQAGEQIGCWLGAGIQKAMSQFNGPVKSQPQQKEKP